MLCGRCENRWPVDEQYLRCPLCRIPTAETPRFSAMSKQKAFDLQYEKYDRERKGPSPEERGALAAAAKKVVLRSMHRTVKQIRELPEE